MKIRIKGNSLRFRLTRSETEYFGIKGYLEEQVEFGNSVLQYALMKSSVVKNLSAEFSANKIVMRIPEHLANEWTQTKRVGVEYGMEIGNGKKLFLVLEKDFKCVDHIEEEQRDNFENPLFLKRGNEPVK